MAPVVEVEAVKVYNEDNGGDGGDGIVIIAYPT